MISNTDKQQDSRYWVRTKYSRSLLNELVGDDDNPDIKELARLCNFLGYVDYMITTRRESSKVITAVTYAGEVLDSNKIYKDFKLRIKVQNIPQPVLHTPPHPTPSSTLYIHNRLQHTIMYEKSVTYPLKPFTGARWIEIDMVEIDSQDRLRKLLGDDPSKEVKVLKSKGLIIVDESYIATSESCERGVSKSYGLTEHGRRLLDDSLDLYLYQLRNNKSLVERTKRNNRDRGYNKKRYSNSVLQNTKDIIDSISNIDELLSLAPEIRAKKSNNHQAAQRVAKYCLMQLVTKKYEDLEINKTTGRIYSPTSSLKKSVKKSAIVNGREFVCAVDVRCCIPTFFGKYCLKLRESHRKAKELVIDDNALKSEVEAYTAIFCAEEEHPRKYLSRALRDDLGYEANDAEIKQMLNEGLNGNGSDECKAFRQWIKRRFPAMYRVWMTTDIRTTGSNLSLYYEKPIFRDARVIRKAKKCFLEYVDNHDEALLFGEDYNAEKFLKWFIPFARKQVGINVQFSTEWADV